MSSEDPGPPRLGNRRAGQLLPLPGPQRAGAVLLERQVHHEERRGHPALPEQTVPLHGRSPGHAPWCGAGTPGQPQNFTVADNGSTVTLSWQPSGNPVRKWAVQARYGSQWATRILLPGGQTRVTLPKSFLGDAGSIAVRGVSAYGAQGPAGRRQEIAAAAFPPVLRRKREKQFQRSFLNASKSTYVQTSMNSHGADMKRRRFLALSSLAALGTISQARQQGHSYNNSTR